MFNHMVEYMTLDRTFAALSDPTRRAILARLRHGALTVSEIAEPLDMSLNAVSKHLKILERASLIRRNIRGREHHLSLHAEPLREAVQWAESYREFWERRLDALEELIVSRKERKKGVR
jgi:DNA-binding transcriptional ArsR family regulator